MQPFVLSCILNSKVKYSRIATEKRKGKTMAAIVKELSIEAAPQRVWGALTQKDEIVQWWANEARVKPEVGSLGEFRFRSPAGVLQFEGAELDEGSKIHWIFRKRPPQRGGASVTRQLTPVQKWAHGVFTPEGVVKKNEGF